jgi:F0F1-type ATP synthase membrane subunit c/vacuolar-type H+-ATPase subunit K
LSFDAERPGDPKGAPDTALAQLQVIAAALASAVAIYAFVAWLILDLLGREALAGGLPAPLPGVLVAVAAVLLLLAPVVERRLAAPARPAADAAPRAVDDPVERYRLAKVVGFALREAAAVVGLVVGLTTGDVRWTWGICLGTLVLMGLAWPRAADLPTSRRGAAPAVEPR